MRAVFADDKNIARVLVLIEVARSVGLDGAEAEKALKEGAYKEAVDRDWAYCRQRGVTAVPAFVVNGNTVRPYTCARI